MMNPILVFCALLFPAEEPGSVVTMPITMQQCIYLAEKNSLALRMDQVDVQISKAELGGTLGTFDTVAFLNYTFTKDINPTASALARGDLFGPGAASPEVVITGILRKSHVLNTGFRGTLLNGASYQADVNWSKSMTSAGTFGGFNPEYRSDIGLSFIQPLLRNFGTAVNKAGILSARNAMMGAAEVLEESRILRAAEVISAYWEYYFARKNVETRSFLVDQAQKLVRINQKKLEVGDARKLDVVEAESDLAARNQELITARNEIGRTADALKRLVFPFDERDEWEVDLIPLTEASEEIFDVPAWQDAAQVALEQRPELLRQREFLKNNDLDILVAENQTLPQFDLNASLRFNQLAASKGEVLNYDDEFYTITAGVSMEMPIGNRTARYGLAAARLRKIRALLEYKNMENQVIQEVRNGVREVRNRKEEIDAAHEAVRLAEERWNAEQKRQEVGYSTTFQVRDAQASWQEAKDAELRALFGFQIARASLGAAQGSLLQQYGILPAPKPRLDDRAGIHYDS
ncbi:MAG: TolC family protein [Planctomycetota bacterium]